MSNRPSRTSPAAPPWHRRPATTASRSWAPRGYLINEFIAERTNHRTDEWGGSYNNRIRFPVGDRAGGPRAVGPDFIIIFRLSMLDLVEGGSTLAEVIQLAQALEQAGVTILNTGIGWHEARIPTIATSVPRAAFTWVTEELKGKVGIPLVTSNRINTPRWPSRCWRRVRPTWCRWPVRSSPTPRSWPRRPPDRPTDQHLYRV